MLSDFEAKISF